MTLKRTKPNIIQQKKINLYKSVSVKLTGTIRSSLSASPSSIKWRTPHRSSRQPAVQSRERASNYWEVSSARISAIIGRRSLPKSQRAHYTGADSHSGSVMAEQTLHCCEHWAVYTSIFIHKGTLCGIIVGPVAFIDHRNIRNNCYKIFFSHKVFKLEPPF